MTDESSYCDYKNMIMRLRLDTYRSDNSTLSTIKKSNDILQKCDVMWDNVQELNKSQNLVNHYRKDREENSIPTNPEIITFNYK